MTTENATPEPAEVGLDLHMLRHNALTAAKRLYLAYFVERTTQAEEDFRRAVEALITGEEEHRKITEANPPVETPSHVEFEKGKAKVCKELRTLAHRLLTADAWVSVIEEGKSTPLILDREMQEWHAEVLAKAAYLIDGQNFDKALAEGQAERPADDPLAYEKKRCAEIGSELRDRAVCVHDCGDSADLKKLMWDAAYWLDRMANQTPGRDVTPVPSYEPPHEDSKAPEFGR